MSQFSVDKQIWHQLSGRSVSVSRNFLLQGHCGACRRKWRLTDTDLCPCGETQTMSHIVESCPLTKLNGGLSRLHSADEDAVSWLTNYGSWHAYEKKKKWDDSFTSPHQTCHVGLEEGEYEQNCLCATVLCTVIMVHKCTSSSYKSVKCIALWSYVV